MERNSLAILKKVVQSREQTLGEIMSMLPKKYNDHRDLYPFVALITGGYIDSIMSHNGEHICNVQNRELAISLYTATFGKGEHLYQDRQLVNGGDYKNTQIFFGTAKAALYLDEQLHRRIDRMYAICIGIAVGIVTSITTSFLKMKFGM